MKLNQSGNKIVVTELNPMSDAPKNGDVILTALNTKSNPDCFFVRASWNGDAWSLFGMCDYQDCDFIGWLPMPVYEPEAK